MRWFADLFRDDVGALIETDRHVIEREVWEGDEYRTEFALGISETGFDFFDAIADLSHLNDAFG